MLAETLPPHSTKWLPVGHEDVVSAVHGFPFTKDSALPSAVQDEENPGEMHKLLLQQGIQSIFHSKIRYLIVPFCVCPIFDSSKLQSLSFVGTLDFEKVTRTFFLSFVWCIENVKHILLLIIIILLL